MTSNPTEDKTRLISLAEASEMYGFNADYLRTLVNRERLQARKIGGVWITTPGNVEEYIKSRKRRGKYRNDIGLDKDS
jgi:hypothetical protein